MWLIVGLGNPGTEYEKQRHNVGFMAVDEIASRYSQAPFRKKFSGLVTDALIDTQKALILKPQTFMNLSGQSVQQAASFYKISSDKIIVIYDELDLLPGQVKVKQGGGSGGHNGIKSMDKCLENKDYWRVRIGIGHPGDKNRVSGYVLSNFPKADYDWLDDLLPAIGKEIGCFLKDGAQSFTNALALRMK
jgi:PTH1 family peptidyl-tRNA hydrolase